MNKINDTVESINTSSHRFVNTSLVQQPSYSQVVVVRVMKTIMVMVTMIMVMVMMIIVMVMMIICHDNVVGDY